MIRWTDTAVAGVQSQRYVVMITDGFPSPADSVYKDSLFAAAATSGVRIFAVGIGPASDQGTQTVDSAVAVVRGDRLLATFTLGSVPVRGAVVAGTVTIEGTLGRATAGWSFVAP